MQTNFWENTCRTIVQDFWDDKKTFSLQNENEINATFFDLKKGDKIFFYGDLWAGKSTYIRHWLRKISGDENLIVRSPTYTYYSHFSFWGQDFYHFDLYRCEDLDTFLSIGGYEILENPENICFIEWPQIIEEDFVPTCRISLKAPV